MPLPHGDSWRHSKEVARGCGRRGGDCHRARRRLARTNAAARAGACFAQLSQSASRLSRSDDGLPQADRAICYVRQTTNHARTARRQVGAVAGAAQVHRHETKTPPQNDQRVAGEMPACRQANPTGGSRRYREAAKEEEFLAPKTPLGMTSFCLFRVPPGGGRNVCILLMAGTERYIVQGL